MTRAVRWSIIIAASMVTIVCLLLVIGLVFGGRSGPEGEYLDLAHEDYPDTSDARLLEVGYEVCDTFDDENEYVEMFAAAGQSPMHDDLMSAAVVTLCPEHSPN